MPTHAPEQNVAASVQPQFDTGELLVALESAGDDDGRGDRSLPPHLPTGREARHAAVGQGEVPVAPRV